MPRVYGSRSAEAAGWRAYPGGRYRAIGEKPEGFSAHEPGRAPERRIV
ncbi:MAG: hypothetical protein ABSG13_12390 [Bryobacteraceae bacterium]